MPRGRPPKSPNEKLLEHSRKRIKNRVEIFAPFGAPFVPEHLNEDATACAEHIIANFSAKHISALDSYALSAFAVAWAWHKAAVHHMNAPGFEPVITSLGKGGVERQVPNPWFKILNDQAKMMIQMGSRLFLTPADRMRIEGAHLEQFKSKFDGLIGQTESYASSNVSLSQAEADKEETSN